MFERAGQRVQRQLEQLSERLREENPTLEGVVEPFQTLDRIGYKTGLLDPDNDSYAFSISWWPMIAVLGTFSAGKSTFINEFVGAPVQRSGSQAVDDKFTVIAYGANERLQELPGLALDGDPRFPFYRVSDEIDRLQDGGGRTVDHFLAMKTIKAEPLRGRILIDSPGFDADEQRATILQLTDHIIDLSDLVIVFFDARHPEPGAMRDTLEHLVNRVAARNDFTKMLFVLNQIDTTWREDNLEEVVSAWQRAVVRQGNATGRFYCMYNEHAAVEISDEKVRERLQAKSSRDRAEVQARINEISSNRSYRIIGALQSISETIEIDAKPALNQAISRWRRGVLRADAALAVALVVILVAWLQMSLGWTAVFDGRLWQGISGSPMLTGFAVGLLLLVMIAGHFFFRRRVGGKVASRLPEEVRAGNLRRAFLRNTRPWRSLFAREPIGFGKRTHRSLIRLRDVAERFVQRLNDRHVDSGAAGRSGESTRES